MKNLFLILFIIPLISFAQESGIQFEHGTNWENVKAKAKTENKHIFVDCFTTWCGPCKYMSANIFPQAKVGEFFNANFVNLKLQMDQTKADSEDVKSWYDEATRFGKDYSVRAYPTFLIFNPDGELVHRIVGGGEADQFIAKAKEGLDPETQYMTVLKKFEANPTDAAIAKQTAKTARGAYDQELATKAMERYIDLISTEALLTTENIDFLLQGATSTKSVAFKILLDNKAKVDELFVGQQGSVDDVLATVIVREKVFPALRAQNAVVDFEVFEADLKKEFPAVELKASLALVKAQYYSGKKNWTAFKDAVEEYLNLSTKEITPSMLNSFAWSIFENCDDAACVKAALAWSKKSLESGDNAVMLDTYANLLYKSGDKETAIATQEKALALASEKEKETYRATLEKMKVGQPTWN